MEVLSEKRAIDILLILYKKGALKVNDIIKEGRLGTGIVVRRVRELEQAGLVEIRESNVWPFAKVVALTEKGKKTAEHLLKIKEILSN